MSNIREIFPSTNEFLRHEDFGGIEQTRTIRSAEPREISNKWGDEKALVCQLEPSEAHPTLPTELKCTRRLATAIAKAVGNSDYSAWAGCEVVLFPTEVDGYGKTHKVIGARKVGA
jgi:hypothetical protein